MGYPVQQNSSAFPLEFLLVSSTDHLTGLSGLGSGVTVTLSKNGGSFASPVGAISEIGNGWYKVAGNGTDTGTLGQLVLHASGAGADPCDETYAVVAYNPQDAQRLGMTALPSASTLTVKPAVTLAGADCSGTFPETNKTSQLSFTVANKVDANVLNWKSSTAPAMTGDAYAYLGTNLGALGANLTNAPSGASALTPYLATDAYGQPCIRAGLFGSGPDVAGNPCANVQSDSNGYWCVQAIDGGGNDLAQDQHVDNGSNSLADVLVQDVHGNTCVGAALQGNGSSDNQGNYGVLVQQDDQSGMWSVAACGGNGHGLALHGDVADDSLGDSGTSLADTLVLDAYGNTCVAAFLPGNGADNAGNQGVKPVPDAYGNWVVPATAGNVAQDITLPLVVTACSGSPNTGAVGQYLPQGAGTGHTQWSNGGGWGLFFNGAQWEIYNPSVGSLLSDVASPQGLLGTYSDPSGNQVLVSLQYATTDLTSYLATDAYGQPCIRAGLFGSGPDAAGNPCANVQSDSNGYWCVQAMDGAGNDLAQDQHVDNGSNSLADVLVQDVHGNTCVGAALQGNGNSDNQGNYGVLVQQDDQSGMWSVASCGGNGHGLALHGDVADDSLGDSGTSMADTLVLDENGNAAVNVAQIPPLFAASYSGLLQTCLEMAGKIPTSNLLAAIRAMLRSDTPDVGALAEINAPQLTVTTAATGSSLGENGTAPGICQLSDGRLLLVYSTNAGSPYGTLKQQIYSGGNWSSPTTIFSASNTGNHGAGSCFLTQLSNGKVWLSINANATATYAVGTYAANGPITWGGCGQISSISGNGATVTVHTTAAHGLTVGQRVVIGDVTQAGYNGYWLVTAVPNSTEFHFAAACSAVSTVTTDSGFCTMYSPSNVFPNDNSVQPGTYTVVTSTVAEVLIDASPNPIAVPMYWLNGDRTEDGIVYTTDGGLTWTNAATVIPAGFAGTQFADCGVTWSVEEERLVYWGTNYDDNTIWLWRAASGTPESSGYTVWDYGNASLVQPVTTGNWSPGVVVTSAGWLYASPSDQGINWQLSSDGGRTWTQAQTAVSGNAGYSSLAPLADGGAVLATSIGTAVQVATFTPGAAGTYSASASQQSAAIAAFIDGIPVASVLECIFDALTGPSSVDNTDPAAPVVTFYRSDGTTPKLTVTLGAGTNGGVRTARSIVN